jgi:hypothetical protein
MMYQQKLVVSVKANGKVLREQGDNVFVPFGSEYSLFIKNLNTVRASVSISIDGEDATSGYSLIVGPNESLEVERFIKDGNLQAGQRFKFIERTNKVEQHRGVGSEDGLIRVEYQFEKPYVPPAYTITSTYFNNPPPTYYTCARGRIGSVQPSAQDYVKDYSKGLDNVFLNSTFCSTTGAATFDSGEVAQAQNVALNDVGITVGGSVSQQLFHQVLDFQKEAAKHVIVMHMRGQVGETVIKTPVTVKHKVECPTCGTKNKSFTKFCGECGTGLSMV